MSAGGGGSLSTTTTGTAVVGGAGGAVGDELKQMTFKCAAIANRREGGKLTAIPALTANTTDSNAAYAYNIAYKVYGLMYGGFYLQQILAGVTPPALISKEDSSFLMTFLIPGFSEVTAKGFEVSEYLLAGVTCEEQILSTCILVEKTKGQLKVLEIWSLTTNPFFLKTGAAAFLIYNIINLSITRGYTHIFLEVARDSFPFISFYERFLLYARYGFDTPSVPPTIVRVIKENGEEGTLDLSTCMFASDIHNYAWYNENTAVIQKEGISTIHSSIENFKTKYPLMYPTENAVRMFLTTANVDQAKLDREIHRLSLPRQISPIGIKLPRYQSACLSHSGYQITEDNTLKTAILPRNVELIIFNTPGYSISYEEIAANWKFNQAYLNHLPIDLLKKYFPEFKFPINVPTNHKDMVDFVKKTSGSIEFEYEYRAKEVSIYQRPTNAQIHCYSEGDTYPDLAMSSELGTKSPDWTSCMFGIHTLPKGDIGYVPNDMVPYPRNGTSEDKKKWASERGVLIKTDVIGTIYLNLHHGLPLPESTTLFYEPIPLGRQVKFLNLSETIAQALKHIALREPPLAPEESMIRIAMFACGNTVREELDLTLQQASKFRLGKHVPVDSFGKYYQMLKLLGESLITAVGAVNPYYFERHAERTGGAAAVRGEAAAAAVRGEAAAAAETAENAEALEKRIQLFDNIYDMAIDPTTGQVMTTAFAAGGGGGATDSTLGKGSNAADIIKHIATAPVERKADGAAGAAAAKGATSTAAAAKGAEGAEGAEWAEAPLNANVNALSSMMGGLKVTDAAALGVNKKSWNPHRRSSRKTRARKNRKNRTKKRRY